MENISLTKKQIWDFLNEIVFDMYQEYIPNPETTLSEMGMDSLDMLNLDLELAKKLYVESLLKSFESVLGEDSPLKCNTTFNEVVDFAMEYALGHTEALKDEFKYTDDWDGIPDRTCP